MNKWFIVILLVASVISGCSAYPSPPSNSQLARSIDLHTQIENAPENVIIMREDGTIFTLQKKQKNTFRVVCPHANLTWGTRSDSCISVNNSDILLPFEYIILPDNPLYQAYFTALLIQSQ